MAIDGLAAPIPGGRSGEDLAGGRKRFTRTYLVKTTSPFDGPNVVLTAVGLPQLYDPYDGHAPAKLIARYPTPLAGTRLAWHVACEWDTNYPDRDDNPFTQKPEIEWDEMPIEQPLVGTVRPGAEIDVPGPTDDDGKPTTLKGEEFHWGFGILNSAGDPYDPPPTRPGYHPVVRYTRNEPTFDARYAVLYGNTVNKAPWNGLVQRQAWLRPIRATNQVWQSERFDTADILYWRVVYTFILKAETWDLALLNVGAHYLRPLANGKTAKMRFVDKSGHEHLDLLKEDGTRYEEGEEKKPTFNFYRVTREVEYGGLDININLNLNDIRRKPRGEA